jgi:hypothetical protein
MTIADIATELVRLIPTVLWIGLVTALVILLRKPIREELLPRLGSFKAFGVELTFLKENLQQAVKEFNETVKDLREKTTLMPIPTEAWATVMRRAQRIADVLQGARILWVDDQPEKNRYELRSLESLGISVDLARSTEEALNMLARGDYDGMISDMARGAVQDEGIRFLKEAMSRRLFVWTVFYVGVTDPSSGVPPGAFGITNRPDFLLHYVMDILERERA